METSFWDIFTIIVMVFLLCHTFITIGEAYRSYTSYSRKSSTNTYGRAIGRKIIKERTFLFSFVGTFVVMCLYAAFFGI